ncbi:hypothetical protein TNIN_47981 [Trichonephila inaurata madagascariensis]|uniref:Uncharacterized protein n=1 Tax=Trichonephila inaurata madagascariensis TaxID=2747483 RepID=A0A8X6MDV0_9ARAC|nr:hypothetical protein TNIN_47981 [Trichonephila inaurata madagascariensis]
MSQRKCPSFWAALPRRQMDQSTYYSCVFSTSEAVTCLGRVIRGLRSPRVEGDRMGDCDCSQRTAKVLIKFGSRWLLDLEYEYVLVAKAFE